MSEVSRAAVVRQCDGHLHTSCHESDNLGATTCHRSPNIGRSNGCVSPQSRLSSAVVVSIPIYLARSSCNSWQAVLQLTSVRPAVVRRMLKYSCCSRILFVLQSLPQVTQLLPPPGMYHRGLCQSLQWSVSGFCS